MELEKLAHFQSEQTFLVKWSPGLILGLRDVIMKSRRLPLARRKPRISPGDGRKVTSEQLIRV